MKSGLKPIWLLVAASLICAVLLETPHSAQVDSGHTYAPMREAELDIKDFNFPTLSGESIRLSEALSGRKLVLLHYFAAWCHNSNYDVVTINELYDKYRDQGFIVIGVCEYSTKGELKKFIEKHKPSYPVCYEGEGRKKDRTGTTHYLYRKKVEDTRLWGTPLNILLNADDVVKEGEIVVRRVRVAPGELVKTEVEELIRERLFKK